MSQKNIFLLDGLDCANCATKIEQEVKNLNQVDLAYLNFINKTLTVQLKNPESLEHVIKKIKEIVASHEPDVIVKSKSKGSNEEDESANHSMELIRLGIGALIFVTALILNLSPVFEFILFGIGYLLIGGEILLKAGKNILRGQIFDENFLMGIATLGAFSIGEYPEGVAVMLFYQIGEFFQDLAVNRSRKSIKSLMNLRPDYANKLVDGQIERVDPETIQIGDHILVQPGEKIPLDGFVLEGNSMVDTSALTGESVPRSVSPSSDVLSGMINKNGVLTIEVKKSFADSTLAKIFDLVENASARKAPTEQFITKFARYYTPIVVFSALSLAVLPPLFTAGTFSEWFYRALVFLVISCPCALVVSIPLSFFGGIGGASKKGILIKGGNYLEALNHVDIAVFDKTGTLTKGIFKVIKIHSESHLTNEELLRYAAYAEAFSSHPIAASIRNAYNAPVDKEAVNNYNEISGYGISSTIDNHQILIGNSKLMAQENIEIKKDDAQIGTVVHIAMDGQYAGYILIADEIKEDAKETIDKLKALGIKETIMLTGDHKDVAETICNTLGLTSYYADLLPDQKVEQLEIIEQRKGKGALIFLGDGINDAPVLARADVGIAMGGLGSDAAIEAADVVLMDDAPSKLAEAISLARHVRKIVTQNIVFALGIKGLVLILGALGFASMWAAVFADVGVALIAVLNSMRALK